LLYEWRGGMPPMKWVVLLPTRRVSMGRFGRTTGRHAATHIRTSHETICGSLRNLRPTPMAPDLGRPLIRSEATDRGSILWILLDEWQGGLPPTRWAARERAPSPEAGEGWDGGLSRDSKGIVARVARSVSPG